MKARHSDTSPDELYVRGPHFRYVIVALATAFILAAAVVVGLRILLRLLVP